MDRGQTDEDSLEARQSNDMEVRNTVATKKVIKADREKLRRDRLNEQFLELGNLLDPDRPKNDKGSIIADTIQVLEDLDSQVKKLKTDNEALCEESRELTREKNELREEKASLKSNIQDLKAQQHQRTQGFMVPWATVDSSILMAPSYPFPVAVPVPPGSVPVHQTIQPLPSYANHHIATSTFIPYLAPVTYRGQEPPALGLSANREVAGVELETPTTLQLIWNLKSQDLQHQGVCQQERGANNQRGIKRRVQRMVAVRASLPPKSFREALLIA